MTYQNNADKLAIAELKREIKRLKIELQIANRGSNRVNVVLV